MDSKVFPAWREAAWVARDIKTIPSCLRSGGEVVFKGGGSIYRGANGVYLARISPGPPLTLRGFESEADLIHFINQNKPWTPSTKGPR